MPQTKALLQRAKNLILVFKNLLSLNNQLALLNKLKKKLYLVLILLKKKNLLYAYCLDFLLKSFLWVDCSVIRALSSKDKGPLFK